MERPARGAAASQVVPVQLPVVELTPVMASAERKHLTRSEAFRTALSEWVHTA